MFAILGLRRFRPDRLDREQHRGEGRDPQQVARGVRRDRRREIGAGESVPSNCLLCRYCSTSCKGLSFLPGNIYMYVYLYLYVHKPIELKPH